MTTLTSPATATRTEVAPAPEVPISCARCGHAITSARAREARDGAHVHTRINPGGWVHRFGCFAEAPGAQVEGPPTAEHSWFPGWAWSQAHCGRCAAHLGWRFQGPGAPFFGLILDHLRGA